MSYYKKAGWQCVSIARYQPYGWKEQIELAFAASKELLHDLVAQKVCVNDYIARYNEETLSKVDLDAVLAKYDGKVVFVGYEKDGFDYRHFLADALIAAGYPCHEIEDRQATFVVRSARWDTGINRGKR